MNKTIQKFTREKILEGLNKLPESSQDLFRRMYSSTYELSLEKVVMDMPANKLDWALTQVENTLKKKLV